MVLCFSGRSAVSAQALREASGREITLNRGARGDINWGRAWANTELNPDIRNATNKRVMRELFKEHGVPIPAALTVPRGRLAIYETNWPIVGRPDHHTKGRGFWLCRTQADIERAVRGTRRKKAATHFMEYIEADREYRVHIFKGKSIRISEKVFGDEEHPKTHAKFYTTGKPQERVGRIRRAAKQAVEALGLDFGAVDILTNDDGVFVLEVNAAPGLGGSTPRLYVETFKQYFEGGW